MHKSLEYLSCDWGTTSFRLRWVASPHFKVLREIHSDSGAKALYEQARGTGDVSTAVRARVFEDFFRSRLERWAGEAARLAAPIPIVISGMASSSIGWRELRYAPAPFSLDASGLRCEELRWDKPPWISTTWLVSGVANEYEMMRGEETEAIGIMANPELLSFREDSVLLLPGTHSKHLRIKNNRVADFRTFMTGELFDVLGKHSLLRASVQTDAAVDLSLDRARAAFSEGVHWARERGLGAGLFRVRTRAVLGNASAPENTSFMSGLLIGAEVAELLGACADAPILLAASERLAESYSLALETLAGDGIKWLLVPQAEMAKAVITAHGFILNDRTFAPR
jgi:2-dehydro-3-deoxygalactonokinase